MQNGVEVIVQARLELGQFAGFTDLLVKVTHGPEHLLSRLGNWHYEV